MITFSVVTITFNAASCLPRTLESVLSQTYPHVEHLIVDGKSTDNTVKLAEDYARRNARAANGHVVTVTSEPDGGLYDAMNKGLARAAGDYVVFLNAGDCFPDAAVLQTIVDGLKLNDMPAAELPAVIYGDTDIIDSEGNYLYPRRLRPPKRLNWRSFRWGMLVCHQAFYARTDIARSNTYNLDYRFSADVDWCIRVMKEAARRSLPIADAHATLANYTEEGQTTKHHRESLKERFHVMASHYGLLLTLVMHCWFAVRSAMKIK